jgi:hypothetical protein
MITLLKKLGGVVVLGCVLVPAALTAVPSAQALTSCSSMKNIYDGVARTNAKGFATVRLPKWFQALNKDLRYQLTSLSGLQLVAVAQEIRNNRFVIQSEKPNSRISWQVTGIRHDRYANANRIQLVVPKTGSDAGKYAHPRLCGQPASKGVTALPAALKYSKQAAAAAKTKTK